MSRTTRRLLHLVRGEPPSGVVGPGDVVLYARGEPAAPSGSPAGDSATWARTPSRDHALLVEDRITSAELVELVFACDAVVVW